MTERPILFNSTMVSATLTDTKTQTRRAMRDQPCELLDYNRGHLSIRVRGGVYQAFNPQIPPVRCPYGQPGDRLWVRETWMDLEGTGVEHRDYNGKRARYAYRAETPPGSYGDKCRRDFGLKWRPSIFMPRTASRITLEVTEVRVERLQDISRGDAMAEGCPFPNMAVGPDPRGWYANLWESINGAGEWGANPWVWVVSFKRITQEPKR
jgi:hypothetical protein